MSDTRTSADGFVVRRRRVCSACKKKFTTYERVEAIQIRVIKRDGSRVSFDRSRLRQGIERACWKRPIGDSQISTLIAQIERDIDLAFETEVQSRFIGERVMYYLSELDQVAYVRFASVYRQFNDANDFIRELQQIERNPGMPGLSSDVLHDNKKKTVFPKTRRRQYDDRNLLDEDSADTDDCLD